MLANFKDPPYRSAAWLECVRALGYCVECGAICRGQAAHRDQGKGFGQKTSDCESASLCDTCHSELTDGLKYSRAEKREIMDAAIIKTTTALAKRGFIKPDPKAENRSIF